MKKYFKSLIVLSGVFFVVTMTTGGALLASAESNSSNNFLNKHVTFWGIISNLSGNTFTMGGKQVHFDSNTQVFVNGSASSSSALMNGMQGYATGVFTDDTKTAINATLVKVHTIGNTPPASSSTIEISQISATDITATTAHIRWMTNVPASSKIWISASNPANTNVAPPVSSSALVTNHDLMVSALVPGTTYFYVVGSADVSGNTATSSQKTFSTE